MLGDQVALIIRAELADGFMTTFARFDLRPRCSICAGAWGA